MHDQGHRAQSPEPLDQDEDEKRAVAHRHARHELIHYLSYLSYPTYLPTYLLTYLPKKCIFLKDVKLSWGSKMYVHMEKRQSEAYMLSSTPSILWLVSTTVSIIY